MFHSLNRWSQGGHKPHVRDIATARWGRKQYKRFLGLPGPEALDVKAALKSGALHRDALLYVANDCGYYTMMQNLAKIHSGQTCGHHGKIEKFRLGPLAIFDWMFLDWCGPWTHDKWTWLNGILRNHAAPNSRLGITVNISDRHGHTQYAMGGGISYDQQNKPSWITDSSSESVEVFRKSGVRWNPSQTGLIGRLNPSPIPQRSLITARNALADVKRLIGQYFNFKLTDSIAYCDGKVWMLFVQFSLKGRKGRTAPVNATRRSNRGLANADAVTRKLAGQRARLTYALRIGDTATAADARKNVKILEAAQKLLRN